VSAEDLPIVCKYCREPLRYVRKLGMLVERSTGLPHFRANVCPVAWGLEAVRRATQVARQGWRI
jgi:hypothetical protein